jgi:hypothetical protein
MSNSCFFFLKPFVDFTYSFEEFEAAHALVAIPQIESETQEITKAIRILKLKEFEHDNSNSNSKSKSKSKMYIL